MFPKENSSDYAPFPIEALEKIPMGEKATMQELIDKLSEDNRSLRETGLNLVEAANRVVRDHDGCHRLAIAASEFLQAVANEGKRSELYRKDE